MTASLAHHHALLTNLRVATAWRIVIFCIGAVWLWMVADTFGRPPRATAAMAVLAVLLAGTALSYLLTRRVAALAPLAAVVNLTVTISAAILLTGNGAFADLYAIPILIAGAFIQPWAGIGLALVIDSLLLVPWPLATTGATVGLFPADLLLITTLAAFIAWIFARDFYTVTAWMYESFLLAEQRTAEARDHRAQLYETHKNLDLAYEQLRRANAALHWARQQAEEARQAKARFVANVSHELRTPLNLIIGFSDMMVTAPESYGAAMPPVYRGDLNAIYRNAKHLASLINDVLDLSQIDAERMPLSRETGDLCQVLTEAARMIEGMVATKGLAFHLRLPPEPLWLSLDVTRIRQVVLNLLSNAIRFTQRGSITVRLARRADEALVTVTDTGAGIAPAEQAQLFEEFYQIDDSIRREQGGTGLGLAISKRFIELHGGHITVESAVGVGSTFGFTLPALPLAEARSAAGARFVLPELRYAGQRILVVLNEDPSAAAMMARHLDAFLVRTVSSLDALVDATHRFAPTAVIVDAGQRRAVETRFNALAWPAIPVISFPLPTLPQMAEQLHATAYLLKPVTRDMLSGALARLPASPRTILVADDDPAMARLLTRMLRAELSDARILQTHTGLTTLAAVRRERPDLLLLDLRMPELDGTGVLAQLQQDATASEMAVIVITATGLGEQIAQFSGEMIVTLPHPLAAGEWLGILASITAALRPVPAVVATIGPAPATALPG